MKISYPLLCYFPSQAGGPANALYWLNKSLGRKGFESTVISTDYGLKDNEIEFEKLYGNYNIQVHFVKGTLPFLNLNKIQKVVGGDIIHFSSLFFLPTLFYFFIGLFLKKKILISPRGELYSSALSRKGLFKSIYLKFFRLFQRRIHFHATNDYESNLIRKFFPKAKSINVLPNYIQIPEKIEMPKKKQILFLGRINPIKNLDLLIKAYHKLPQQLLQEFKLIIAGEAILNYEKKYLSQLHELVGKLGLEKNILFLGGAFGEEKQKLLSESYCTILPSKSENFGNVALESLCQATPAIVSKNTPWAIIEEFKAGFWVDTSTDAINKALEKILTMDENQYHLIQTNALSLALGQFDIEKNLDKWVHLYQDLK
jgi:glycosyltransferase involved in cell wall biosynthesis